MIDWIERRQRNPSLGSGALLLDAYGGALNRPAADATAFVHRDMLFSLQYLAYFSGGTAGRASRRWINGVLAGAAAARIRRGVPELHRPAARRLAARVLRVEPGAPARDQEAGGSRLPLSLPAGDPAGALMDRDSLRGLRAQPGYLSFLSAATLARVSDEMFSVGVVLLVLDRTDSAGLAGATVAALTLPSLVSGPLLGAWLDLTGRRRTLMVIDQLVIAAVLVALVLLVGHAPGVGDPARGAARGRDLPALVRRLHEHDPGDCSGRAAAAGERASRPRASTRRSWSGPRSRAPCRPWSARQAPLLGGGRRLRWPRSR